MELQSAAAAEAEAAATDRQTLERQRPTGVTTLSERAGQFTSCLYSCRDMADYFHFSIGIEEIESRFVAFDRHSEGDCAPRVSRRLLTVTASSTAHQSSGNRITIISEQFRLFFVGAHCILQPRTFFQPLPARLTSEENSFSFPLKHVLPSQRGNEVRTD